MKDMTVETLNFIILCMGLLFVMAGIFLIVGKLAGKRPASIAVGVLMIAWGLLCGIPESRSWMLARATDLEHLLEAMWAGLDGDGRIFPLSPFHPAGMSARCSMWNTSMSRPCGRASTSISLSFHAPAWH